ncbi:MAG: hypothetical protein Q9M94_06570 [Candidatus Gracilibacteria bacterium]|nr:hypothetical protein [Candidatus Gracilibacteria bacterium]MDQ7022973.1 hypothetical protein [Candidatus Gracilibacteria bacterium]
MIGFQLGREWRLSIAEILAVFNDVKIIDYTSDYLILDNLEEKIVLEKASNLGGSIKIMKIFSLEDISFEEKILDLAAENEGKFKYGITVLGDKFNLKTTLMKLKKELKNSGISSRFVNKDFKSINSATIIGENLVKRGTDFSVLQNKNNKFLGKTIWIQDINAYSKRDYAKSRDMQVGMLPPKLSQMMINLSGGKEVVYDPFIGLGTILIEAELMGFSGLYGSDLNQTMVETSSSNTKGIIEKLNAKFINEATFFDKIKTGVIVTEGYLGEVMTQKNISKDRILEQRKGLEKLYNPFFENLKKGGFSGTIVMSFPFWEVRGNYYYFEEIYSILEEYCEILPYFPEDFNIKSTKTGSLLYKREKQLVGREIFKLKIK